MDARLVSWARAVKARTRTTLPVLWLFTDGRRAVDWLAAVERLPPGLGGVVFRHDGEPGREDLARLLARACRRRRVVFCVAGDAKLARRIGAGVHLRENTSGRALPDCHRIVTASAHGRSGLVKAARRGARMVFLSPAFATQSHAGARPLGALLWLATSRGCALPVLALGGVDGTTIGALGRTRCAGAGAIGALVEAVPYRAAPISTVLR